MNNPAPGSDGFGDEFGELVALSGPNLMVAASSSGSNDVSGLVDAFGWTGKKWRWLAKLVNPLGANDSRHFFGVAIAMSGSTAMIGDIGANSAGSGAVYLYRRTGTSWHQEGSIPKPPGADGRFGWSVAVSGGTAVIGDPGTHGGAGSAYVYVRSGAVWRKRVVLTDPGRAKDDYFGYTVSASGSTLVVAAPWADNIAGMAYVYEPNGRSWSMRGKLVSPHPEHLAEFGRALAVSGSRVLVGVPVRGGGSKRCGTAYAYTKSSSNFWRLREQVVDPGCSYNDKFGFAVALQGRTAIIGAPLENQADGAAYVLTLP